MKTDLGTPQYLEYLTYLDCKKRTKKQVEFRDKDKNDEVLMRTILANSSVVEHENERSYSRVYDAVDLICKPVATANIIVQVVPGIAQKHVLLYVECIRNILRNRKLTEKRF